MADQTRFAEQAMPLVDSIYGGALQMTRSRPDAEALVQETHLRAYRAFATFEAEQISKRGSTASS